MSDFAGLTLRDDFDDEEPRIRDEDLAAVLEYPEHRAIRKLIKRSKNLSEIHHRDVLSRRGVAVQEVREYWLTKRQALRVVVRSRTDKAEEMTEAILDIFEAWERGELALSRAEQRILALAPGEWDPMFETELVNALCDLRRKPRWNGVGRQPRWLAKEYAEIYRLVLGERVYRELKARNGAPCKGSNHHQWLQGLPRSNFRKELSTVLGFARAALSMPDPYQSFWGLMKYHYGSGHLQLCMGAA